MGSDITYIDTDEGVCYLHLLTDAFTHEIIGWTLSESLVAENTLEALEQAVSLFGNRSESSDSPTRTVEHSIAVTGMWNDFRNSRSQSV